MAALIDAREFGQMAKDLRRAPKSVRDEVKRESRTRIAEPLAAKIKAAAGSTGPWSRVLVAGVKTRAGAEPTILVGGTRPKLSGGGGPRSVVFGTEWGGGKRFSRVLAYQTGRGRTSGHRRASTAQFRSHKHPFIFPTVGKHMDSIVEIYADIVVKALEKEVS